MLEQDLPRFRCEFQGSADKNLIAKFFHGVDAQEAYKKAQEWHNDPVKIIVTPD